MGGGEGVTNLPFLGVSFTKGQCPSLPHCLTLPNPLWKKIKEIVLKDGSWSTKPFRNIQTKIYQTNQWTKTKETKQRVSQWHPAKFTNKQISQTHKQLSFKLFRNLFWKKTEFRGKVNEAKCHNLNHILLRVNKAHLKCHNYHGQKPLNFNSNFLKKYLMKAGKIT